MTEIQKEQITKLRSEGCGYMRISQVLGLSENTVKSFCRRNNLTASISDSPGEEKPDTLCVCCGMPVKQRTGRKEKKFCSDKCRNKWWNSNLDKVNRRANYEFICPHCKKTFAVYGNAKRKYCCHACYIADRFGGDVNAE